MKLPLSEILKFGECTMTSRNLVEGEKILNANHILKCGKTPRNDLHEIVAYCLQTSDVKGKPHELKGNISVEGLIINFVCSCKAGLSQKCKHVIAVLLFCNRNDLDEMDVLSGTDIKCQWNQTRKMLVEQYKAVKVEDHPCFSKNYGGCDSIYLSEKDIEEIKNDILSLGENALTKHFSGRHSIYIISCKATDKTSSKNEDYIKKVMSRAESSVMKDLSEIPFTGMKDCCKDKLFSLHNEDALMSCLISENSYSDWIRLRQFRITGSRLYQIYTYCSNKKPDREKKAKSYFYPQTFKSIYTAHGKTFEKAAITEYEKFTKSTVITCGVVISRLNSWLSYSPDGIVFKDMEPFLLIQVKCPFAGKTHSISEVLPKLFYLEVINGNCGILKQSHMYYCQIQMGMAVLNVKNTHFVIYASFDATFVVIQVPLNVNYIFNILKTVKENYLKNMLHYVCINKSEGKNK